MVRGFGATVLLAVGLLQGFQAVASPITPEARRIAEVVDHLDVEHHWPAGVHVNWKTGIPDGKPVSESGRHTHCSAFVASAAEQLGIYILRPPEHPQTLLANAQHDWLLEDGHAQGWVRLDDAGAAQKYANRGWFVVATYRNHHDDKPGHIAIIRPSDKSDELLRTEGPQITQAGTVNYRSTSLREGFSGHPAAWQRHEALYFAHAASR
jgi:hypothetical protein